MNEAMVILLVLANQGFWYAGSAQHFEIESNVELSSAVVVEWWLAVGELRLASGRVTMEGGRVRVPLKAPQVRVVTEMTLGCRLVDGDGVVLEERTSSVFVFPEPQQEAASLARLLLGQRVLLVGEGALNAYAQARSPKAHTVGDVQRLQTNAADVVIVEAGVLAEGDGHEPTLYAVASGGATVVLLEQGIGRIAGYAAALRAGSDLKWRLKHPILRGLEESGWSSVLEGEGRMALQLPVEDEVMEVVYYAPTAELMETPLDALVAVKRVGAGRIIWCQLPVKDPASDPRSGILLDNLLRFAVTRVEPTPRQTGVRREIQPRSESDPQIAVPAGARP